MFVCLNSPAPTRSLCIVFRQVKLAIKDLNDAIRKGDASAGDDLVLERDEKQDQVNNVNAACDVQLAVIEGKPASVLKVALEQLQTTEATDIPDAQIVVLSKRRGRESAFATEFATWASILFPHSEGTLVRRLKRPHVKLDSVTFAHSGAFDVIAATSDVPPPEYLALMEHWPPAVMCPKFWFLMERVPSSPEARAVLADMCDQFTDEGSFVMEAPEKYLLDASFRDLFTAVYDLMSGLGGMVSPIPGFCKAKLKQVLFVHPERLADTDLDTRVPCLGKALRSRVRKDAEIFWDDARYQFQDHYGIHEEIDAGCQGLCRTWQELDGFVPQREEVIEDDAADANLDKVVQRLFDYEQKLPMWIQQARGDGMVRFQQQSSTFFAKVFSMVMVASESAPMKRKVFPDLIRAVALTSDESLH